MTERVVIAGVPRAGKTTLAAALGRATFHTDDYIHLGRDGQIGFGALSLESPEHPWEVFEGVYMAHAMRKWLADHPTRRPCDRVIWMPEPRLKLTRGQHIMLKGILTVWSQIEGELRRRGVPLELGGVAAEHA